MEGERERGNFEIEILKTQSYFECKLILVS